ncbi:hypothetical protein DM01DRAFT_3692 [Hesseltinella vesiculosa]|uniref:Uncharacterized protein n=1 Tax=Hesseltinella vesiculosa TaxID=101127 RepID=A0A1X2GT00_9FUNG|nr:hypothetical protein DM01DRAFT_3692 [Hesseltinella vesiculosa]
MGCGTLPLAAEGDSLHHAHHVEIVSCFITKPSGSRPCTISGPGSHQNGSAFRSQGKDGRGTANACGFRHRSQKSDKRRLPQQGTSNIESARPSLAGGSCTTCCQQSETEWLDVNGPARFFFEHHHSCIKKIHVRACLIPWRKWPIFAFFEQMPKQT